MTYGKVAFQVLHLVVLGVLARLLTPDDFGVVSAALVVAGLSTVVSQLGVGPALVQRPELEQRHVDTGLTLSVLLGLLLGGVIWVSAPLAARFLGVEGVAPVLRVLAWIFPVRSLGTVAASLLTRKMQFQWLANLEVISYALGYGAVGITAALLGFGVWALVAAHMTESVVRSTILLAKHTPRVRPSLDGGALRDLLYFGGGFTIARLANYVATHGDNAVTARYLGSAALGFYGRAYSLMSAPAYAFGQVLDRVLFPAMAKVQHEPLRLKAAYRRGVAMIATLVLPASASFILLAPELIRVVLGPRWEAAVGPFRVLGLGMLFRTSYKMSDSIARSTGAVYRRAWRQIVYATLVCVGAWIGQHWGITGVAWGAVSAVSVNFFLMAHLSLQVGHMTWREFWGAHRPGALLTAAGFLPVIAATLLARHLGIPALGTLAAAGTVLALTCTLLAWWAPGLFLGRDGQWMLETFRSYIAKVRTARRERRSRSLAGVGAEERR
jgi:PST family polysaccharide transporter